MAPSMCRGEASRRPDCSLGQRGKAQMFAGLPTEFSEHVGGSEGCGLERQACRQWGRVCGGEHSGQSPGMTPWKEGQGG